METGENRQGLQRSRDELLAELKYLAHQLSQPVTILRGSIELALMGTLDPTECRKTLEQSLQQTDRIIQILFALRELLQTEGAPGTHLELPGNSSQPLE